MMCLPLIMNCLCSNSRCTSKRAFEIIRNFPLHSIQCHIQMIDCGFQAKLNLFARHNSRLAKECGGIIFEVTERRKEQIANELENREHEDRSLQPLSECAMRTYHYRVLKEEMLNYPRYFMTHYGDRSFMNFCLEEIKNCSELSTSILQEMKHFIEHNPQESIRLLRENSVLSAFETHLKLRISIEHPNCVHPIL